MIENTKTKFKYIQIYIVIIGLLLVLDVAFIIMIQNEANTSQLLKKELIGLEQNNLIISSSKDISSKYTDEIDMISHVFPSEASIPDVIKEFETLIQANSDTYRLKFNSITPVSELDRLYLPLTVTVNTDLPRLITLLNKIENMTYMTHINNLMSKNTENFLGKSEIIISLKLYVQNPFSSK